MFKFQTILSGKGKWVSNLFLEDKNIGTIGLDEEGLFIKSDRNFTLKEINLLIAQITSDNPELLEKELELLKS